MLINTSSIFIASLFTVLSLLFPNKWSILVAIVAPLLKFFGGGAHASAFLTLATLSSQPSTRLRSAHYYITGSVIVFAQACSLACISGLSKHAKFIPGIISGVLCLVAYGVVALSNRTISASEALSDRPSASVTDPLLPPQQISRQGDHPDVSLGPLAHYRDALPSRNRELFFVALAFFLMAISKATRPLFTSYIQHRDGITAKQAETLWLVRGIMSIIIFGLLLPLAVGCLQPKMSSFKNITLHIGRISIILMGSGALMIGLSTSLSAIITALVVNTLGVATDLSILAFSTNMFSNETAGRVLMLISSIETVGTLLGVGILYPVYQWSLARSISSLSGGLPYYVCSSIYAIVAGLIWSLKPVADDSGNGEGCG